MMWQRTAPLPAPPLPRAGVPTPTAPWRRLTDTGHAAQVLVHKRRQLRRLQLPRLLVQAPRKVLALLLGHLRRGSRRQRRRRAHIPLSHRSTRGHDAAAPGALCSPPDAWCGMPGALTCARAGSGVSGLAQQSPSAYTLPTGFQSLCRLASSSSCRMCTCGRRREQQHKRWIQGSRAWMHGQLATARRQPVGPAKAPNHPTRQRDGAGRRRPPR